MFITTERSHPLSSSSGVQEYVEYSRWSCFALYVTHGGGRENNGFPIITHLLEQYNFMTTKVVVQYYMDAVVSVAHTRVMLSASANPASDHDLFRFD